MATYKLIERYKGFKINKLTDGSRAGKLYIESNGINSVLAPGSVTAARRMIDVYLMACKIDKYFNPDVSVVDVLENICNTKIESDVAA